MASESERIVRAVAKYFQGLEGVLTDNVGRESVIIGTDVMASNGIVHVIDNVVLPALP